MATPSMTNGSFNTYAVIHFNWCLMKTSFSLITLFKMGKYSYFTVLRYYFNFSLPGGPRLCLPRWMSVLPSHYNSQSPQALPNSRRHARRGSAFAYYHTSQINTVYRAVHNTGPLMANDFVEVMMGGVLNDIHIFIFYYECLSAW